jgi:excisionase family DNA binding protein
MLRVKDVAEKLGCSTSLVYEILRRKELPYRLIGKRLILIEEEDLNTYFQKTMIRNKE